MICTVGDGMVILNFDEGPLIIYNLYIYINTIYIYNHLGDSKSQSSKRKLSFPFRIPLMGFLLIIVDVCLLSSVFVLLRDKYLKLST